MSTLASQITGFSIVYSTAGSGAHQRIHKSSVSMAFVWGIYRWPVNSLHKRPVTRKMFSFDDVIMIHWMAIKKCVIVDHGHIYRRDGNNCYVSVVWKEHPSCLVNVYAADAVRRSLDDNWPFKMYIFRTKQAHCYARRYPLWPYTPRKTEKRVWSGSDINMPVLHWFWNIMD